MATVADLRAALLAKLAALPGPPTRLASDMRRDIEPIAAGATRFALSALLAGVVPKDFNATRQIVAVDLAFLHRLAGDERAFTESALDGLLAAVTSLAWWKVDGVVWEVETAAALEAERIGNVVRAEISARLVLT